MPLPNTKIKKTKQKKTFPLRTQKTNCRCDHILSLTCSSWHGPPPGWGPHTGSERGYMSSPASMSPSSQLSTEHSRVKIMQQRSCLFCDSWLAFLTVRVCVWIWVYQASCRVCIPKGWRPRQMQWELPTKSAGTWSPDSTQHTAATATYCRT